MTHPVVVAVLVGLVLFGTAIGLKKPEPTPSAVAEDEAVLMLKSEVESIYRAGAKSVMDRLDDNQCLKGAM